MANERLRSSIAAAGLTVADVAAHVRVDPKTVERWIRADRTPYPRHRRTTAALLRTTETYLWPELLDEGSVATAAELVGLYPSRASVPPSLWFGLLHSARRHLDVLVCAGLFLWEIDREFTRVITEKGHAGTKVRLALRDPGSGLDDGLASRIRLSLAYLRPADSAPGVELGLHACSLHSSIYRFDDDMLVNLHTYGVPASLSPVLHLRRFGDGRLFDHYLASFDRVWSTAAAPDRSSSPSLPQARGAHVPDRRGLTAGDVGELTGRYERLRRRVSGVQLLGPVRAHVHFVSRYLRDISLTTGTRPPLVSAMGEAAVLAGRLAFWDLHDEAAARQYFEMAGDAAQESGDRALRAYALAFTAGLLTYVRQPEQALGLSRAAQELAEGAASARVRSWLAAVEAEAAAHVDDVDGCVRALDRAQEAMVGAGVGDEDPPWIEFFDQARLAGYAGACLVRIGHEEALPVLRHAAEATDVTLRRYRSEIAADLAWALAREGEVEESCRLLEGAYETARAVDYRDGVRRVFGVRRELDVVGRVPAIAELDDRLRHGWTD